MRNATLAVSAIAAVMAASAALAQTAPETTPAQTPTGENWNAVSRSATRVYMVDVNSIRTNGGVATINLARIPLTPPTVTDRSYTLVEMEIRCAAKQSRAVAETDHDAAGAPLERFDLGEEFGPYSADTLDGYVAAFVCEDARAESTFPSVAAFIDAGRPSSQR